MSKEKILEGLLWEKEIYPPLVLDSHYYDIAEMTRAEIIEKTLVEMAVLLPTGEPAPSGDEDRDPTTVITELQRRLPYGKIKTCGAFQHLNAGCCNSCHTYRPHFSMELMDAPDGSMAWVCCGMRRAIYPKPCAERMERFRNSPAGKLWMEMFRES
jgi:hypothetical protein